MMSLSKNMSQENDMDRGLTLGNVRPRCISLRQNSLYILIEVLVYLFEERITLQEYEETDV